MGRRVTVTVEANGAEITRRYIQEEDAGNHTFENVVPDILDAIDNLEDLK